MTIIATGAEATLERAADGTLLKKRLPKSYRIPMLDARLRETRTKTESAILRKLHTAGINVPAVYATDIKQGIITLHYIEGQKLRDVLTTGNAMVIGSILGQSIRAIHDKHIIHGDLTTSNIIVSGTPDNATDYTLSIIDFGLAQHSRRIEDKAVDLHILEQSLEAYHWEVKDPCFDAVLNAYGDATVLDRLNLVRQRGKNKAKY